jgi:hypothetical protein
VLTMLMATETWFAPAHQWKCMKLSKPSFLTIST